MKELIERVTRRVKRRLVEDAEQDRLFRQQAVDVYESLVEYLKQGGELKQAGRAVTIDQFADLEQQTRKPLKIVWKGEIKSSGEGAYSEVNGQPTITLFVMEKRIYSDVAEARKDMIRGLQDHAKVFMHEYIHYLDDKRTELGLEDLANYNTEGGAKELSDYFSDPIEVNAFFQSGLAQLQSTLEVPGVLDSYMKRDWNEDFQDFKDWFFDEHLDRVILINISEDQRRRLINRLYGFWNEVIIKKYT